MSLGVPGKSSPLDAQLAPMDSGHWCGHCRATPRCLPHRAAEGEGVWMDGGMVVSRMCQELRSM